MAAALGYALSKAFERLRMDAMTEPKGLLDLALAGVLSGNVYDIELPNGVKTERMVRKLSIVVSEKPFQIWKKQVRSPLPHLLSPQTLGC